MKAIRWMCLNLLAASILLPASLAAQNPIYFPYVVNDAQTLTELIFTNATGRDATIALTGYQTDGTVRASSQSPVFVPANGQAVVSAGTFGTFRGWVRAESNAAGVAGNVRISSADGSAVEVAEPSNPSTEIVLPFLAQGGGKTTEISIVNPTPFITRVSLALYRSSGQAIGNAASFDLGPFQTKQGSLDSIFGQDQSYDEASHLIARSTPLSILSPIVNLVGFEVVRGYFSIPQSVFARTDWAALSAIPLTSGGSNLIVPHVVRGLNWFSLIGLVNTTASAQSVTFTYKLDDGTEFVAAEAVPAQGSLRRTVKELFPEDRNDHGTLFINSNGNLAGFHAVGLSSGVSIGAMPIASRGLRTFVFPVEEETSVSGTGVVLKNDTATDGLVSLFLISPQGATIGTRYDFPIPAFQRRVASVKQLFPEGLDQSGNYVFGEATVPLFTQAVVGNPSSTLSQLVGQPVAGFSPPAQSVFGVRGTVVDHLTSAPLAGVTLTLSRLGSSSRTTTTDANGEYLFAGLDAGEYTLMPSQQGKMFSPTGLPSGAEWDGFQATKVSLKSSSERIDFRTTDAPAITGITVITTDDSEQRTAGNNPDAYAIFGTAEVSLKIEGENLVQGQRVFFASIDLNALTPFNISYVDSRTLFVKLALDNPTVLEMLAKNGFHGRYDMRVSGQAPFDSFRSNAMPFYVVPPLPVLTSVISSSTGRAETFARYEINSPGETLRVLGFGFRPGARVLFNSGTNLNGVEIDTKYISPNELEAYLPPQALRFGGLFVLRVRNVSELPEVSGEAVNFQINNLRPEISSLDPPGPLEILGPGPGPVLIDLKINGSNFHPAGGTDLGTTVAITNKIPDIFPAIVPVGGPSQCIPVNGRTVLRVRVFNTAGVPVAGVAVRFTAPSIVTTTPSGSFPGGASTVTVFSDALGFAPPLTDNSSTLFTANPFAGAYVVSVEATVDGFPLLAVFNLTNLNPGEACTTPGAGQVTFVSSSQIIVTGFPITGGGTYGVVVANSAPGGGISKEVEFIVTQGPASSVPKLPSDPGSALSPSSRPAGSNGFNLTVSRDTSEGAPFQSNAWVNFGTVRLNRVAGNGDSIVVFVPDFLIASPGIVPITVTNPGGAGNTGGTSNRVLFSVTNP
ncbi:MAG: DUF5719 family protein [Acidobacteriota bacterium]